MTSMYEAAGYEGDVAAQRAFVTRVYGWMTAGLMLTGIVAMGMAATKGLVVSLFREYQGVLLVLVVVQFGIAVGLSWLLARINAVVAMGMFVVYALITGVFFSVYFLVYTQASLATTFFVTAGTFGGMAVFGLVTKRDLTGVGSFCMMGLWGLVIASIVNMFMGSSMLYWVSTYVGVLVFTGLTAYDSQKIKYMYMVGPEGSAENQKAAIMGAFTLYLDFVILFQYLLRLLENRRDD